MQCTCNHADQRPTNTFHPFSLRPTIIHGDELFPTIHYLYSILHTFNHTLFRGTYKHIPNWPNSWYITWQTFYHVKYFHFSVSSISIYKHWTLNFQKLCSCHLPVCEEFITWEQWNFLHSTDYIYHLSLSF